MQKNGEYMGEVLALGSEGEGIIKLDGGTAFVPYCLVGEKVSFKALKVKNGIAYGKLTEVHTLSADRVAPQCPVFEKCGGCQLQHLSYAAQLDFKRQLVENNLKKIGAISVSVEPTVASQSDYRYRNKLVLPVGVGEDGQTAIGFYAARSHRIVPISDCPLQKDWVKKVIGALKLFMCENGLSGYDEQKFTGDIRHFVGREVGKNFIFTVVATKRIDLTPLSAILEKQFEGFTLLLNINKSKTNAIFGKEWRICHGEGFFEAEDLGVRFKAGANTFLQVNDGVRSKLYSEVVKKVADRNAVAIDLYSGGGMLTAMLANVCKEAYGIEIVEEAVACADQLKEMNGLDGKMFNVCGAVEDEIGGVFARTEGAERVIVCDPPRKGMERSVIDAVLKSGADRVVLISCNPSTLARDLGLLCGTLKQVDGQLIKRCDYPTDGLAGFYSIDKVQPFDMFPQTKHVETLVTLFHKKPDSHIEVTVDLENGKIKKDGIIERAESKKPKEKPTYKMIQKWVEENYGLKVHTAYIAEVKRDLGLPMYNAPNAVEELKKPRAHPTPQMVEAIKAALKHFEII